MNYLVSSLIGMRLIHNVLKNQCIIRCAINSIKENVTFSHISMKKVCANVVMAILNRLHLTLTFRTKHMNIKVI